MPTPTNPPNGGARSVSDPFGSVYTPAELANLWKLSEQSIRRLFQDLPGVLKIGETNPRGKRTYITIRIPAAIAAAVFQERSR